MIKDEDTIQARETIGGRLRLTGFVETAAERSRAAEIARRSWPDREVVNELLVWTPGEGATASPP